MISTKLKFLDRDLSLIRFNERVLALAQRRDYPLLERLKFLCIVASNLDEFFEVRMDAQLDAQRSGIKNGAVTEKTYHEVSQQAHVLVAQQYDIFNHELMPALKAAGVDIVSSSDRTPEQKKWILNYFQANVKPLLLPIALDLAHPFPLVASKALHFIVELEPVESSNQPTVSIIRVPRSLPRLIALPNGHDQKFVTLTSIIGAHLSSFFTNRKILSYSQFRVTRHSDIALDEDDMSDLPSALRHELAQRPYGEAVRLEVSKACSDGLSQFLLNEFRLPYDSLYRVSGPVNLGRLIQLTSLAKGEALTFPAFRPQWTKDLLPRESFFERLKRSDALSHRPFENFDSVLQFLEEAVNDPDVLAIHQTIYRTGSDPRMLNLLQEAVKRGKEVLVVVEIKARFDEETNINWAASLEAIGAQIVYGMLGLKTHAKMLLVMRQEGKRIKRYAHLSTGNYNASTAKLYTDICMFTSDITITREVEYVFRHLTSQVALPRMQKLLVAPFNLQLAMLRQINSAKRACELGGKAKIIAKMNSLTDEVLVRALINAAQKGVQIDLIVRGACILPVDAPGIEGRVRVRSIIGRFLEHSRVFYFEINGVSRMWLSSADWMSRNMIRRIEIAWPILGAQMQAKIMQECIEPYLADTEDTWMLSGGGNYLPVSKLMTSSTQSKSAQKTLIKRYSPD
jgi:polyphosphate kinase